MRLLLVELVDDDVELSLQDVDLPLGQFLLAPPQRLLLALLLQCGLGQLLFPRSQLLRGQKGEEEVKEEIDEAWETSALKAQPESFLYKHIPVCTCLILIITFSLVLS